MQAAKEGEPCWESPWGLGRPGWHIECSAMSAAYLGYSFDIHGGGMDLVFPHHENEIAQSCAACKQSNISYWIHNGFVTVDSEKMSKSLGNFFTIRQVKDSIWFRAINCFPIFVLCYGNWLYHLLWVLKFLHQRQFWNHPFGVRVNVFPGYRPLPSTGFETFLDGDPLPISNQLLWCAAWKCFGSYFLHLSGTKDLIAFRQKETIPPSRSLSGWITPTLLIIFIFNSLFSFNFESNSLFGPICYGYCLIGPAWVLDERHHFFLGIPWV